MVTRTKALTRGVALAISVFVAGPPPMAQPFVGGSAQKLGMVASATSPVGQTVAEFAKLLESRSAGRLPVQIFADGQLGGFDDLLQSAAGGNIALAVVPPSALMSRAPEIAVLQSPFEFRSEQEVLTTLQGPVGHRISEALAQHHLNVLSYWVLGWYDILSRQALAAPSEFKGLKIGTMSSTGGRWPAVLRQLGALEVRTRNPAELVSLDGIETAANPNQSGGVFDDRFPVRTRTRHRPDIAVLIAGRPALERMGAEERDTLRRVADEIAMRRLAEVAAEDRRAVDNLRGRRMVDLTAEQVRAFRKVFRVDENRDGDPVCSSGQACKVNGVCTCTDSPGCTKC